MDNDDSRFENLMERRQQKFKKQNDSFLQKQYGDTKVSGKWLTSQFFHNVFNIAMLAQ